jgi:D-amino-acid dehydrogenase
MKIAVIGAGIVGVTTAYELAQDGHQVTVLEQRGAAAEEASFANAGVLAPGYVTPWAAPGMPWKVVQQLFATHAAVRIGLPLCGADIAWMWRFWRACNPQAYLTHRAALQKLAFYSRSRLHAITEQHQLSYDRADGYMVLLRSAKDAAMVQPGLRVLRDAGVAFNALDEAGARLIEPALNTDTHFHGAVHLPQDEVGNCRQFALLLKDIARGLGVDFQFNTLVHQVHAGPKPGVELTRTQAANSAYSASAALPEPAQTLRPNQRHTAEFDAVVLCAGSASAQLCRPLGKALPMRPIYGYSVSAHVREPLDAPRSALMDEHYKVAISRLGALVRVAGSAEIGGQPGVHRASSLRTLYKVLHDWFPGAAVMRHGVQEWKGARPMLANRPPIVGASGAESVWLNTGHGSSGWALSSGSARLLADAVAGRASDIDAAPYQF